MANGHGGKRENSGRPRVADELKGFSLARPHVEEAFKTIVEIMRDEKKRPADRINASKIIIEYACGKPKETIDTNLSVSQFDIKELFKVGNDK